MSPRTPFPRIVLWASVVTLGLWAIPLAAIAVAEWFLR